MVVQVEQLTKAKTDLQTTVESQSRELDSLNNQVDELKSQVKSLSQQITHLNCQVEDLTEEKSNIQSLYDQLDAELNRIHDSYDGWESYLLSYSTWNLNYTIKRVFADQELLALKDILSSKVLSNPSDLWRSYQDIYDWITKNVKYAYDEPFPKPPTFRDLEVGEVSNEVVFDSMMSPSQTLEIMQGDCDDQAALAFSMVKSYNRYIYSKEYSQWLIAIKFNNGRGHMAIVIPVQGQDNHIKLTILDPAGKYLTSRRGSITSNDPFQELTSYSNHWLSQGGIQTITLYTVKNNLIYVLETGSVSDVAKFISNS
ncbi:MAG: coiled-coil domain-containing protein [Nitrososphaeria archaeon]